MRIGALIGLLALPLSAAIDPTVLDSLRWRSIGPAAMGGRISDLDGIPGDPSTMFAASGSGGLFVTNDGGTTWASIFDRQSTISIGAIAVQHDRQRVIWVGTGESNVRNSVSFGDGVYKSEDGGANWKNMGLRDTQTISRIVINPRNPDVVYVAAVGHPFGPNAERGVFVTEDGGRTWRKSLFIDSEHGAADLELDPANPEIVYAGMWRFDRKPWTYTSGSEKGGLFRSSDAGRTWKKITAGLPTLMGRIGVKVAPTDPNIVYIVAETKQGTLFRSQDRGLTFAKVSDDRELIGRGYYYCDLRIAPNTPDRVYVLSDALLFSNDAGKSFERLSPKVHGDVHALWIDPKDPRRMWQGHDGGLSVSYSSGSRWEQVDNIPLGQFYRVTAGNRKPFYEVIGGLQDNGSWIGPSQTREPGGIFNSDWRMVNGIVGFQALIDPDDPDVVLTETPGGGLLRTDLRTREQQSVAPQPRSYSGAPASEWKYRFGWDAPLVRSPFGNKTIYFAGNIVFQSSDSGRTWENISPDLTRQDASRMGSVGGPVFTDNSTSEIYSTISAFAESPLKRGVLWAGTDDGNLQVTFNGGGKWSNVPPPLTGARMAHIEPSKTGEMTAYAALERHMLDDFRPYLFKTADGGKSWQNVSGNLPANAFVWTVREDIRNPSVLYAGTELGIYASVTGGGEWFPLHLGNLPWSIAVRDIVQQPDTNDLVIATHGRSLWVLDDATVLAQLSAGAQLFEVRPATRYSMRASRTGYGDKPFTGTNAAYGALITTYATGPAKVQILDRAGALVRELKAGPGFTRLAWDLRYEAGPQALPGTYTVRLIAGGRTFDKPLELRLDPMLQVPLEDLTLQFETSRKLREMSAAVRATGKYGRPKGMSRSETGPRLAENLEALYTLVDAANAAPTPAMMRYFAQLEAEFQTLR